MTRLFVLVEGQTEERFVEDLLAPHLYSKGFTQVAARIVGKPSARNRRGGIVSWPVAREEFLSRLREDRNCHLTTIVDYYAMPAEGADAWPGRHSAASGPKSDRASIVETKIFEEIAAALGSSFDPNRFIPFVVMHEFEALLFSNCLQLAADANDSAVAASLQEIRDSFATPEDIDDSVDNAPSKRILKVWPKFKKALDGIKVAERIGLPRIRQECPHFNRWLSRLESLA